MVINIEDMDTLTDKVDHHAVRINGAMMNNFQNSLVIIMGFVQRLEGENKRIVIKTTDGVYVQVMLLQPLTFILEPEQLIEAYGIVRGGSKFECQSFTHFDRDESKEFNCEIYNQFIQVCITHKNRFCSDNTIADQQHSESILQTVDNDFDFKTENDQHDQSINDTFNSFEY
ncbi:uncharacterized protein LOC124494047 [Dermatophagoides farinae]|uniref:uncharacterized protein LOC124494047 n=1 Tax=Dermatophagoides farinae TaxID=6954 RepID=UPI003F646087